MYAYAKEKAKPQPAANYGSLGEDEILAELKNKNVPLDDPKAILDRIKLLNPKLKNPHLLVGKYRSLTHLKPGSSSGDKSVSSVAAPASKQYSEKIVNGALYLYSTSKGAYFINSLIRKEKGQDIDIPDSTDLAMEARRQFANGNNSTPFAPGININKVIKELSIKGHAIEIMNQAAQEAEFSGMNTYYRGAKYRAVLSQIKPGDLVSTNFIMSVTGNKKTAEKFSHGKYNTEDDLDELGVMYDIVGNPKTFNYGVPNESESIYPVGAKFKYIGRKGTTYSFMEQSPSEVKKYKGNIYRLYR